MQWRTSSIDLHGLSELRYDGRSFCNSHRHSHHYSSVAWIVRALWARRAGAEISAVAPRCRSAGPRISRKFDHLQQVEGAPPGRGAGARHLTFRSTDTDIVRGRPEFSRSWRKRGRHAGGNLHRYCVGSLRFRFEYPDPRNGTHANRAINPSVGIWNDASCFPYSSFPCLDRA